jgi:hypothetical protein
LDLKRPEHEADYPTQSSAKVNSKINKLISGLYNKAAGSKFFLNI